MKNVKKVKNMNLGAGNTFLHFSSHMASFGIYVSDSEPDLLKNIQARADAEHDGKVSAYARAAILRDLAGGVGSADSPTILIDLTRSLLGALDARTMEKICSHGWDQPQELRALLRWVIREESKRLGISPEPVTRIGAGLTSATPPPLRSLAKRLKGSHGKTPQAAHEETEAGGEELGK